MTRAKKGTVRLDIRQGMLRIRLPKHLYNGQQKDFYLGLSDTPDNRRIAQAKVDLINADIIFERFDFSLEKYKAPTAPSVEIDVRNLWAKYMEEKRPHLTKASFKNLITVQGKLETMPTGVLAKPANVKSWLLEHYSQEQSRRVLMQLNACCNWALEQELIKINPFDSLKKIKKVTKDQIDPFSAEERSQIISAFSQSEPYFQSFVEFLFFTGCRPSEAVGLEWAKISGNHILFKQAIVEGVFQEDTKTHKSRRFPINEQLREILDQIPKVSDFVFVAKLGGAIDLHNFTNRIWKPVLTEHNIRYRPPYNCRHTFITLCLDVGVPIQQVAQWVGNSPEVILKHYAGLTRLEVPTI